MSLLNDNIPEVGSKVSNDGWIGMLMRQVTVRVSGFVLRLKTGRMADTKAGPAIVAARKQEMDMYRFICWFFVMTITATLAADEAVSSPKTVENRAANSFTVWQLPNQAPAQMMSYVIRARSGKLIVIDGGRDSDAGYLKNFIKERGGSVEAWFITHPHNDHIGAVTSILLNPEGLVPGKLYAALPDAGWMKETGESDGSYEALMAALDKTGTAIEPLTLGETFNFDDVHVKVLGVNNPEIRANAINNSSVVLRFHDAHKSVLFLADLGLEGGRKLLEGSMADDLPSDYVQMAHHGQNGVGEEVYQKINPRYCLWPTPKWLWDNDSGTGKGSGPWKTLEVREWMDRLQVKKHYLLFEGLQTIE